MDKKLDLINLNNLCMGGDFPNPDFNKSELWFADSFLSDQFVLIIDELSNCHQRTKIVVLSKSGKIKRANDEKRRDIHKSINDIYGFLHSLSGNQNSAIGFSEICLATTVEKVRNWNEYSDYNELLCESLNGVFWEITLSIFKLNQLFDGKIKDVFEKFFNIEDDYPEFHKESLLAFFTEINRYINGEKLKEYCNSKNPLIISEWGDQRAIIKVQVEKVNGFFDASFFGVDRDFFLCLSLSSIYLEKRKNRLSNGNFFKNKSKLEFKGISHKKKVSLDFGEHIIFEISNKALLREIH